jgi:hypothetical protein
MTDAGRMITVLLTCRDSDNPREMLRFIVDETHRRFDAADADAIARAELEDTGGES